jgi:predicted aconitase with swiveling domain
MVFQGCGRVSNAFGIWLTPRGIGSSSASAVLLELVHAGLAPAAIVMHEPDAILLLGLIVAREMDWPLPLAVKLARTEYSAFAGATVTVSTTPS